MINDWLSVVTLVSALGCGLTSMLLGDAVGRSLDAQLRSSERDAIEAALLATRGRIAGTNGAAKRLGLAPSTLESRLERMGIDKFHYRSR